jgi:hypothetical protein
LFCEFRALYDSDNFLRADLPEAAGGGVLTRRMPHVRLDDHDGLHGVLVEHRFEDFALLKYGGINTFELDILS